MTSPNLQTVCVVIPTLKRAHFLDETLTYLIRTTYPHHLLEIFVVDGGPDEATRLVVEQFQKQTDIKMRYYSEPGLRNSPSRNFAVKNTVAEIIIFLDDDCITRPEWIHTLVQPVQTGEADIAGGTDKAPDDDPFLAHCEDVAFSSLIGSGGVRTTSKYAPLKFCPLTCNMAMRRDKVMELGGFDESIRVAEDTDFAYKARVRNFRVKPIPEAQVRHRRRAYIKAICFHNYIRGYARLFLHKRYPQFSDRAFLLPAAGLVVAGLLGLAGFVFPWAWGLLAAGILFYLILLVIVAVQGYLEVGKPAALVVVPFLVFLHHFWYAVGTLHAPLTNFRKVYVTYQVNVSDPFGRERKIKPL